MENNNQTPASVKNKLLNGFGGVATTETILKQEVKKEVAPSLKIEEPKVVKNRNSGKHPDDVQNITLSFTVSKNEEIKLKEMVNRSGDKLGKFIKDRTIDCKDNLTYNLTDEEIREMSRIIDILGKDSKLLVKILNKNDIDY